jgi:hypothetical protein
VDTGGVVIHSTEWGEMNVALETFPAGTDTAPIFVGLPDDRCQSPHWGYVLKGRVRVRYSDRDEVLETGDAFYMEPGHTTIFEEDTEVVEFSPRGEYQKTLEVAQRNVATMNEARA